MKDRFMEYEINAYTYKARSLKLEIYARTKETADKIAEVMSTDAHFNWKRKIFGFCKKTFVDKPPLEVEDEQMEYALQQLDRRRKRNKAHF